MFGNGWARHYGPLALAGFIGLLAPTGCTGDEADELIGQQGGSQQGRDPGGQQGGNQGSGQQGGQQGGNQGSGQQGGQQGGDQQGGQQGSGQQGGNQGGQGQQGERPSIQSDEEIAGFLRAFNMAEVQYSQMACVDAEAAEVHAFAEAMILEHTDAIARQGQLFQQYEILPVESAPGTAFIGDMGGWSEGMSNLQGAELDRMYMEMQAQIHLALLDFIDTRLLPVVENEALRAELEAVRAATLQHLMVAQQIHCALGGEPMWEQGSEQQGEVGQEGEQQQGEVGQEGEQEQGEQEQGEQEQGEQKEQPEQEEQNPPT